MKTRNFLTLDKRSLTPLGALTALLTLAAQTPVMAADRYWVNPTSGAWEEPTNWTEELLPDIPDAAFITNGGTAVIASEAVAINNAYLVDGGLTMSGGSLALQTTADVISLGTNLSVAQTPGGTPAAVNGTFDLTLSNDAALTGRGKLYFGIGFFGGDYGTGSNLTTTNISLSGTSSIRGSTTNANYVVFGAGGGTVNMVLNDSAHVAKAAGGSGDVLFGDGSGNLTTLTNVTVDAHDTSSIRSSNGVWLANNLGSTATVTLHESSYIQSTTNNAGHLIVANNGGVGVLNVTETSYFTVNDALAVGFGTNSNGMLNYSSTATSSSRTAFNVGHGNNARGTVNMTAGSINTTQAGTDSYFGGGANNALAELTVSGDSTIASGSALTVAADGSKATVALSGNADVTFSGTTPKAWFYGNAAGKTSSLTMSGDSKFTLANTYIKSGDFSTLGAYTISLEDNAALSFAGRITIGHWGGNAASTATVTIAENASFTANDYITIGKDDSAANGGMNTQLLLNGGTLATKYIASGGGTTSATNNTLVANGGTIKALEAGEFFRTTVHNATRTYVEIESGGLKFDTNGLDVVIPHSLNGDAVSTGGGLTKLGTGTLTLNGSNFYTGATTVSAGGLAGTGAIAGSVIVQDDAILTPGAPTGTLSVGGDATFQTGSAFLVNIDDAQLAKNGAVAVTGTLNVSGAALLVNVTGTAGSAPYTIATAGSVTGPFASVPSGFSVIYGATSITISPSTDGGSFTSWAGTNNVTGGADGDSDFDGILNLVEYALDLNPAGSDGAPGVFASGTVAFTKRDEAVTNGDVTYTIQTSTSLAGGSWTNVPAEDANLTETDETISYTLPIGGPKVFARLLVTQDLP